MKNSDIKKMFVENGYTEVLNPYFSESSNHFYKLDKKLCFVNSSTNQVLELHHNFVTIIYPNGDKYQIHSFADNAEETIKKFIGI